ncbi:MAG: glucose-6-phosphate isomerase [bacterium]
MKKKTKRIKISLNFNNLMSDKIGAQGITEEDLKKVMPVVKKAMKKMREMRDDGKLGFMYLPYDNKAKEEVKKIAEGFKSKFENFVVVGIGGSALGTTAVFKAIQHPYHNELPREKRKAPKLYVMDNVDPDTAAGLFDIIDVKKTCVNIISKSGETAETTAFMKVLWAKMSKEIKKDKLKDHIIMTTDKEKGALRKIANDYGFASFPVPENVGGRFSVLTPVGLFPLACVGVDIDELLKGAAYMDSLLTKANSHVMRNPAYMYALVHYLHDIKFGKKISVLMPYANALKEITDWFAQIWGESLGKKMSLDGKVVNVGLTPVKALGATDQHSQVQLYVEGPYDKVTTFIRVEKFKEEVILPDNFQEEESLNYLSGKNMGALMNAEQKATEIALTKNQRANMTISLPELNEFALGQLLYMLQVATAFAGELYDINAFNQPGVELSKLATFALMGRKGYKEKLSELKTGKDSARYII